MQINKKNWLNNFYKVFFSIEIKVKSCCAVHKNQTHNWDYRFGWALKVTKVKKNGDRKNNLKGTMLL